MNTASNRPNNSILYALLAGVHLSALPLYRGMPIAIILLLVLLSAWELFLVKNNKNNPARFVLIFIVITSLAIILYSYGHIFGQQPGTALIILMTLLKLFEIKSIRDCYIVIFSSFFIIANNFFHSQSVWLILYVFLVLVFLLSILVAFSDRLGTMPWRARLKISSRFILYALPLMLVLFVLFPRIPGPLWGLPDDAFSNHTGISEEMSPGSINRLINSSAIAFRVQFEGTVPTHEQRYWRGAVLSLYDGKTWRRSDAPKTARNNIIYSEDNSKDFNYRITLEPTDLSWLLSLDYPLSYDHQYSLSREAMLLTKNKINNVLNYRITSQPSAINRALFEQEAHKNRLLPLNLNPQTVQLARNLLSLSAYDLSLIHI